MSAAERPLTVVDMVRKDLENRNFRAQLQMALPPHVLLDKFVRTVMTAIQSSDQLRKCDRQSLLKACMESAADGLLPDGREGAIVPHKMKTGQIEATWMPMVWGLVKLVRQSGELLDMGSEIIRESDKFERWIDEKGPHFRHTPNLLNEGDPMAVYAYARTKDGGFYIEVMSWTEVLRFKAMSKAKSEYGPWAQWTEEMAKARVIKRMCKRLPMSTDAQSAFERDAAREAQQLGVGAASADPVAMINAAVLNGDEPPALDTDLPALTDDPSPVANFNSVEADKLALQLKRASDSDTLAIAADLIGTVEDETDRSVLTALYQERRAALEG